MHHPCMAGFIMAGVFAYGALFITIDYILEQNKDNVWEKLLEPFSIAPWGLYFVKNEGYCIGKHVRAQ